MSSGVLYHTEMGVYLGSCMGFGWWSKLDPVGQTCAVTFQNKGAALHHAASWDTQVENLQFRELTPDDGQYASILCCVRAGLPGWSIEA